MFRHKLVWRVALCAAAAILLSPVSPRAAEKTDFASLLAAFDQMAMRDHGRVSKWTPGTKTLTLKVTAKFGEKENKIVEAATAVLAEHAKLKIVRNDEAEKPDFLIETSEHLKEPQRVGYISIGLTNSTWGRVASEMRQANIQIIRDWYRGDPYRIYATIPHEMLHALGFHGHPQAFDSVLSMQGSRNSLSEWDLFFVRVLYDPKLPVGTPRAFALPLVCRLMHDRLVAENNTDVTDLNRDGPQPYCAEVAAQQQIVAKNALDELRFAWAYLRGLGVIPDFAEAERWAKKALAGNDQDAQKMLDAIEKAKIAAANPSATKR